MRSLTPGLLLREQELYLAGKPNAFLESMGRLMTEDDCLEMIDAFQTLRRKLVVLRRIKRLAIIVAALGVAFVPMLFMLGWRNWMGLAMTIDFLLWLWAAYLAEMIGELVQGYYYSA